MDLLQWGLIVGCFAPLAAAVATGLAALLHARRPSERTVFLLAAAGLLGCVAGNVAATLAGSGALGDAARTSMVHVGHPREVDFGPWIQAGTYVVPVVALVDRAAMAFGLLAAALTTLVAFFSRTYLHKDPGFLRFFVLLGLFASGTQVVAWAGSLDVMFAGWELMGWSSALYIGFFQERREPVRSALRAFVTYRLCDVGFLLATVATHEYLGSTRLSALSDAARVAPAITPVLAALFLLAAAGKSALLPCSGWLARAMEGPTPSSALFYGGISIHAGLFLVLRTWPVLDASPLVEGAAIGLGLLTAVYATGVARVHADAKGALAHATLAQVGLIFAEIAAGFTGVALVHLVGHALLRVWQYLRAPNTIHEVHRLGHPHPGPFLPVRTALEPRAYFAALHRLRLDEALDRLAAPVLALARGLERVDGALRRAVSLDGEARR